MSGEAASSSTSAPPPLVSAPVVPPTLARLAGRALIRGVVVGLATGFATFAIMLCQFAAHSGGKKAEALAISSIVGLIAILLGLWTGPTALVERWRGRSPAVSGALAGGAWLIAFVGLFAGMLNAVYIGGMLQHRSIEGGATEVGSILREMVRDSRLGPVALFWFAAFSFPFAPVTWARLERIPARHGVAIAALATLVVCTPFVGMSQEVQSLHDDSVLLGLIAGLALVPIALPFLFALADRIERRISPIHAT